MSDISNIKLHRHEVSGVLQLFAIIAADGIYTIKV
jgi:hypothetical protein